ncbi:MAG: AAA family ATPase [Armatimonadetes bacterium]|nr:AAA family ATPase [Armatimonadota bacterium]
MTQPKTKHPGPEVLRPPAEELYAEELQALARADQKQPKPPGWKLSPRAVRSFLCGCDNPPISRKFYGDDVLVERAVIGLAGNRGLLLVGEPGTAKTMLSELLTSAISATSTNTIQGTAGTTEDQIKYSWNYALLLAEGPTPRALVPAPLYVGMQQGLLVRFEEITRCPPEVQDALVSVLSDKVLVIPELADPDRVLLARPGFNVVATANTRDRGVHEMSSALKRRFNFETVQPIQDLGQEVELVARECERQLALSCVGLAVERPVIELLVTAFQDMRRGVSAEGFQVERPASVMSTAEAVSVAVSAALDAYYYGDRRLTPEFVARHLAGAVLKDQPEDRAKLRHYFDVVVAQRSKKKGGPWSELHRARKWVT